MKCEHNFKCIHCKHTDGFYESFCKTCVGKSNFECKICKKKNEDMKCLHDRENCQNCTKLIPSRNCVDCTGMVNFECKLCKENAPLTIPQLEGMNGERVWVANKEKYVLVNAKHRRLYTNYGCYFRFEDVKAYKEKPSPRMVTLIEAIKENLETKIDGDRDYHIPIYQLLDIKGCSDLEYEKFLREPVWEVKEVDN